MRTSIATLPTLGTSLLTTLVTVVVVAAGPAYAQSGWSGSTPVFEADARKAAEQAEAERAARRATYGPTVYPKYMDGGERPDIKPAEPPTVYFDQPEEPGTIIVDTQGKRLFYVLPGKKAFQYPISVGRDGFTWAGTERISRITAWPSWTPPAEMHKRVPGLPITVTGGLKNPQGARALYLGSTIYRIHGTNNDRTVGRANSSGCFRLTNEHVVHLARIAKVGAKVKRAAGLHRRRQRGRADVVAVQLLRQQRAGKTDGSTQETKAGRKEDATGRHQVGDSAAATRRRRGCPHRRRRQDRTVGLHAPSPVALIRSSRNATHGAATFHPIPVVVAAASRTPRR